MAYKLTNIILLVKNQSGSNGEYTMPTYKKINNRIKG
jgi:hypothetical protein